MIATRLATACRALVLGLDAAFLTIVATVVCWRVSPRGGAEIFRIGLALYLGVSFFRYLELRCLAARVGAR